MKNKIRKAQVAMEFLFVIGIVLLLTIFVLYDVFNKQEQLEQTKQILSKKDLCLSFSSFISGVYIKGIGTEAYLKVEGDQLSYPVTIQPGARNIFVGDTESIYCNIPISSVSNSTNEVDWFRFDFDIDNRYLKFENCNNSVIVSLGSSFDDGCVADDDDDDDDDGEEEQEIPT